MYTEYWFKDGVVMATTYRSMQRSYTDDWGRTRQERWSEKIGTQRAIRREIRHVLAQRQQELVRAERSMKERTAEIEFNVNLAADYRQWLTEENARETERIAKFRQEIGICENALKQ